MQLAAYRQVLQQMAEKPVIIRTLDIGGDKEAPCLAREKEETPVFGLPGHPVLSAAAGLVQNAAAGAGPGQCRRSALHPAAHGDGVEEVRAARRCCVGSCGAGGADGIACDQSLRLGVME